MYRVHHDLRWLPACYSQLAQLHHGQRFVVYEVLVQHETLLLFRLVTNDAQHQSLVFYFPQQYQIRMYIPYEHLANYISTFLVTFWE